MGYRYRFIKTKKETLNTIKNMTPCEFIEWSKEQDIHDRHEDYIELHNIGDEFFDLCGVDDKKLIDKLRSMSTPLFTNNELTNRFAEYAPYVAGPELITPVIHELRNNIVSMYEKLTLTDDEYLDKTGYAIPQEYRQRKHIENLKNEWKFEEPYISDENDICFAIDLNNKFGDKLTNSNRFEYDIFNLAFHLKSTNWDEYDILFLGW